MTLITRVVSTEELSGNFSGLQAQSGELQRANTVTLFKFLKGAMALVLRADGQKDAADADSPPARAQVHPYFQDGSTMVSLWFNNYDLLEP